MSTAAKPHIPFGLRRAVVSCRIMLSLSRAGCMEPPWSIGTGLMRSFGIHQGERCRGRPASAVGSRSRTEHTGNVEIGESVATATTALSEQHIAFGYGKDLVQGPRTAR